MVEAEPEKQELASRDVVSRHMMHRIQAGGGVDSPNGRHLWLDVRHLGRKHLTTKLLEVFDICRDFAGIDPVDDLIPVLPTQHYSMGGVRVNKDGEAYGMQGLFAVGEAACWDMHGFNRLGGNSLAETIVAGRVVGARVAKYVAGTTLESDLGLALRMLKQADERVDALMRRDGSGPSVYEIRDAMGEVMIGKVGIFRSGDALEEAVAELGGLLAACDKAVLRCKDPGMNPELTFALRLPGMLRLALTVATGALAREESRGAHSRIDFPLRDDKKWLNRTLARWTDGANMPSLSYEPVGLLDLPPGHRGYGSSERIEMVATIEQYNAEVGDAQKQQGRRDSVEPMGSELPRGAWKTLV
jgi:fumarate reductase flavoprotein subunit